MRNVKGWKNWLKIQAAVLSAALVLGPGTAAGAQPWTMENGQYVDASGQPVVGALEKGITVTKYQNRASQSAGGIDWAKVAADGISFAMVRIGYLNDMDPYYTSNMEGASTNGIKTGVFFYTQALNPDQAREEAEYVLKMVKDYPVSYPIAYDVESQYLLDNGLTKDQITDNIIAFCETISEAGYRPVVYANHNWLTNYIDQTRMPYDIWYARYGSINNCQNRTIWQCTDEGQVDGIGGNVTIEFSFADYSTLIPGEGWKKIDGNWYYTKDYRKQTGWVLVGDKWYYLDSNGIMINDTTMDIEGVSCTFGPDGAWVS